MMNGSASGKGYIPVQVLVSMSLPSRFPNSPRATHKGYQEPLGLNVSIPKSDEPLPTLSLKVNTYIYHPEFDLQYPRSYVYEVFLPVNPRIRGKFKNGRWNFLLPKEFDPDVDHREEEEPTFDHRPGTNMDSSYCPNLPFSSRQT